MRRDILKNERMIASQVEIGYSARDSLIPSSNKMNNFLIDSIKKYQTTLSPQLQKHGVECIFKPSCSQYAVDVLEKYNIFKAIPLIIYRLLSCNPINAHLKLKSKNLIINKHIHGKGI